MEGKLLCVFCVLAVSVPLCVVAEPIGGKFTSNKSAIVQVLRQEDDNEPATAVRGGW